MEVRCSNCETEYEFDDALVSARGTSVKCTQCGHQFRVRRAGATSAVAESWLVTTTDGNQIDFKSLRELQQGIVQGKLGEDDSLTHGGQAPRPLKDIYELQTFFASARARAAHPASKRTLLGGAGTLGQSRASSLPPPRKRPDPVTPVGGIGAVKMISAPSTSGAPEVESLTSSADASAMISAPASSPLPAPSAVGRVSVPPAPRLPAEALDPEGAFNVTAAAGQEAAQRSNPPPRVSQRPSRAPAEPARGTLSSELNPASGAAAASSSSEVPWQNMQGLHATESELPPLAGRSSGARSRWIAALVVLGALGLVGGTVGKDYILKFVEPPVQVPVVDKRVPLLLQEAYGALGRGDFESARIAIAKAEVLAEKDSIVAAALARLEISHAESHWLELRVLKELAVEVLPKKRLRSAKARAAAAAQAEQLVAAREQRRVTAQKHLTSRIAKARVALAVAQAPEPKLAPGASAGAVAAKSKSVEPVEVARVQVDLLRLEGKLSEARKGVKQLSAQASNPDNAHTLGALDLAEEGAGLLAAIGRLRIAARRETGLGKSRSMLVYALARSGDRTAASAELDKLKLMAEQHPLLADLAVLVERLPEQKPAEVAKPIKAVRRAPSKKSSATGTASASGSKGIPVASGEVPANNTAAVEKAERLHRSGDLKGAERLYSAVIKRSPTHVGALSGMGDVYRQRGATAQAMAYYNRVLSQQPMHLRTVMASADMNWAAKRQVAAVNLYRRALGQVGTSHPYGARALRRIEEFESRTNNAATVSPTVTPTVTPAVKAPAAVSPSAVPPAAVAPVTAAPAPGKAVPAPVTPAPAAPVAKPAAPVRRAVKKKGPTKPPHPFAIPSPVTPPPRAGGPAAGSRPGAPVGTP